MDEEHHSNPIDKMDKENTSQSDNPAAMKPKVKQYTANGNKVKDREERQLEWDLAEVKFQKIQAEGILCDPPCVKCKGCNSRSRLKQGLECRILLEVSSLCGCCLRVRTYCTQQGWKPEHKGKQMEEHKPRSVQGRGLGKQKQVKRDKKVELERQDDEAEQSRQADALQDADQAPTKKDKQQVDQQNQPTDQAHATAQAVSEQNKRINAIQAIAKTPSENAKHADADQHTQHSDKIQTTAQAVSEQNKQAHDARQTEQTEQTEKAQATTQASSEKPKQACATQQTQHSDKVQTTAQTPSQRATRSVTANTARAPSPAPNAKSKLYQTARATIGQPREPHGHGADMQTASLLPVVNHDASVDARERVVESYQHLHQRQVTFDPAVTPANYAQREAAMMREYDADDLAATRPRGNSLFFDIDRYYGGGTASQTTDENIDPVLR